MRKVISFYHGGDVLFAPPAAVHRSDADVLEFHKNEVARVVPSVRKQPAPETLPDE